MSKDTEVKFSFHKLRRAAGFLHYKNAFDLKTLHKYYDEHISTEMTQIYIDLASIANNPNTTK